jgi:hypothetical protein
MAPPGLPAASCTALVQILVFLLTRCSRPNGASQLVFVQAIVVRAGGAVAGPKELVSFLVNCDDDKEFVLVFPVPNGTEDGACER